jgi:tRNA threonylcarbamoyladenosine biosynthesis protein TsaB
MADNKIKILSLESSGSTCGVALSENEKLVASYSVFGNNMHDKLLADFIKRILSDLNLKVSDIDAVAVSAGPGSFTGLRIGVSIAKALCHDGTPGLIAVPTLTALANYAVKHIANDEDKTITAVLPSHKNFIYYQHFDSKGKETSEIFFEESEKLLSELKDAQILVSGTELNTENIKQKYFFIIPAPELMTGLAYQYYKESKFEDAEKFLPLYVQDFVPKSNGKN